MSKLAQQLGKQTQAKVFKKGGPVVPFPPGKATKEDCGCKTKTKGGKK